MLLDHSLNQEDLFLDTGAIRNSVYLSKWIITVGSSLSNIDILNSFPEEDYDSEIFFWSQSYGLIPKNKRNRESLSKF